MTPARRKRLEIMLANSKPEGIAPKRKRGGQPGNKNAKGGRGNKNAKGRPRGRNPNAFTIKLNIAISELQQNKLKIAADKAGLKYTDFIRNFIESL